MQQSETQNPSGEKKKNPPETRKEAKNVPIQQSLLPLLTELGTHSGFATRGISEATCSYLGCGFLPADNKSSLRGRLVFQVRSVDDLEAVEPKPVILTHMGRATTPKQIEEVGKWTYKGFRKSLEFYNIDQLRLDPEAHAQIKETGRLILVEGCFDVAKCVEAGVKNVMASFETTLNDAQIAKLHLLKDIMGAKEILVWFDRDKPGTTAQAQAITALEADGLVAKGFDWDQTFQSDMRADVGISDAVQYPGDFLVAQIQQLIREMGT